MVNRKAQILLIGCLLFVTSVMNAQDQKIADSLFLIYQRDTLEGTAKFELLRHLSFHETRDLKKGLQYAEELIRLSEQANDQDYLRRGYFLKGTKMRLLGKLDEALNAYFKSVELAKQTHQRKSEGQAYGAIGDIYSEANNHANAMTYYNEGISVLRQSKGDSTSLAKVLSNAGDEYVKVRNFDSALLYFNEARLIFDKVNNLGGKGYCLGNIGMVYDNLGKPDLAVANMNEAISILEETQDYYPICVYLISIANVYLKKGDDQAALKYALRSLNLAEQHGLTQQIADAGLKLSEIYEKAGNGSEAFKYYKKHIAYRDSVNNIKTVQKMADLRTDFEVSQKQTEVDMLNQQKQANRNLTVSLAIILALTILVLAILFKSIRNKQIAYRILNLQKKETETQKEKAENALSELQLTQKQLLQTAKMASLGELTTGVAHEIQNPLNFVNNFSEISVEMLNELREGTVNKLNVADKKEADAIINDLADNLRKINDHGKRADLIVKSMLQHSMASTGKKEPTDINALAEEYLRLSYHGIRAKDKVFNASLTSDFDRDIGNIEVVPQEIGRVFLNLYNNAFYAVKEKKKQGSGIFEPRVSVTTRRIGNKAEISIRDNGTGIPSRAVDKIFHPFFTTKPAGQGAGLGLSMSYDIIMAHGGEMKVESMEGEFAEFIIQLPISTN